MVWKLSLLCCCNARIGEGMLVVDVKAKAVGIQLHGIHVVAIGVYASGAAVGRILDAKGVGIV